MHLIPMSHRDEKIQQKEYPNLYVQTNINKHLPLPGDSLVRKFLIKNKKLINYVGFNDTWKKGNKPRPLYSSNVVPSTVHKDDLLIKGLSRDTGTRFYIHISEGNIDDLDPRCDISIVTHWGALYIEDQIFSSAMENMKDIYIEELTKVTERLK